MPDFDGEFSAKAKREFAHHRAESSQRFAPLWLREILRTTVSVLEHLWNKTRGFEVIILPFSGVRATHSTRFMERRRESNSRPKVW